MIQIELEGIGYLDTFPEMAIQFEFLSPLFKNAIEEQGYSYPIDLPLSDNNAQKLGFVNLADSLQKFEAYPCNVYFDGVLLVQGNLKISNISTKVSAYILEYQFDTTVLDSLLREIDLGGDRALIGTGPGQYSNMYECANDSVMHTSNEWDFVFTPVYDEDFYRDNADANTGLDAPHTYSKVVNFWDFKLQSFWQPPSGAVIINDGVMANYTTPITPPTASTFVPYPYVVSILRYISKQLGYTLTGDWAREEGTKKLIIYNTYALDFLEDISTFTRNTCNKPIINLKNHVPNITIKEFLNGLAQLYNLSISFDFRKKQLKIDARTNTISNAIEIECTVASNYTIAPTEITEKGYLFEMGIDATDENYTQYAELVADENLKEDVASTFPITDNNGTIRFFSSAHKGYLKAAGLLKNSAIPQTPKLKIGKGGNTYSSAVGTIDTTKNISIDYAYEDYTGTSALITYHSGIIPIVKQKGNSEIYFSGEKEDYSFRVFSFAGMHTDPNGFGTYPIGTSNIYDDNGNAILPYSIKWRGGDFALYDHWWKNWLNATNGKIVTVPLAFTWAQFLNLNLGEKLRIQNRLYLIKTLSIGVTQKGFTIAKAKCVQLSF
jgi:hypothetical protein